jgi:hypothetical protein
MAEKETPAKDDAAQQDASTADKPTVAKATKSKTSGPKLSKNGVDKGTIMEVAVDRISRYDNPRHEPSALFAEGYALFGDPEIEDFGEVEDEGPDQGKYFYTKAGEQHVIDGELMPEHYMSLLHMAISSDIDEARAFVDLIEEYENVNRKEDTTAPQSIVELSESMVTFGQLVPILVRKEKDYYIGIDGGRRITAVLYLHAHSRVLRADKDENAPSKVYPARIKVMEWKGKPQDDFTVSLRANLDRKDFGPLEQGSAYCEMLEKINPATGKKWNMKDAAAFLNVQYSTFRNRVALHMPIEYDDTGKRKKGLTDSERQKVVAGELGVTAASRKALGEKHYSESGAPVTNRRKSIPLKMMEKLYDETAERNAERRTALAECMGFTGKTGFAKASKESEKRIAEQDQRDAAAE